MDVNLAVNNLLSRDDEEGEEGDDTADSYVPEDLISLLDGGFHTDHSVIIDADAMFSEDMFGYTGIRRYFFFYMRMYKVLFSDLFLRYTFFSFVLFSKLF